MRNMCAYLYIVRSAQRIQYSSRHIVWLQFRQRSVASRPVHAEEVRVYHSRADALHTATRTQNTTTKKGQMNKTTQHKTHPGTKCIQEQHVPNEATDNYEGSSSQNTANMYNARPRHISLTVTLTLVRWNCSSCRTVWTSADSAYFEAG